MPNCTSLDQAIVPIPMYDRQRTFTNCLLSNDLELRFLGTILCEMDDLDQTPTNQSLFFLWVLGNQGVWAQFCLSKKTFDRLKL